MTAITPEIVAEHGLSPDEYERVLNALGREPNLVELGVFSVMWSEHCSYKSSRRHLRKFPTTGPRVAHGPGGTRYSSGLSAMTRPLGCSSTSRQRRIAAWTGSAPATKTM